MIFQNVYQNNMYCISERHCSEFSENFIHSVPKIFKKNLVINLKIQTLKYCTFCSEITVKSRTLSQHRKITANFLKGMSKDRKRTADFIKRIRKLHQKYCKFHQRNTKKS